MSSPPWEEYDTPNHGNARPETRGVIVHSTRGGQPPGTEYLATIAYFLNPASQVSAHVVLAQDGRRAKLIPETLIAWHARGANVYYLGVELEQGKIDDPFTEDQYRNLAYWLKDMADHFGFPLDRDHILGHEETEQGRIDGKTDPGPRFDWAYLFQLFP